MVKNDYDETCWQRFLVSVLLVSWLSLNCVSAIVDVLVALWWCVRDVLTVFGDVLGVLLMSWACCSCLGVVSVVSWWCCGMVSSWYLRKNIYLIKLARLSIPTWRQTNETRHFAIGVVGWVNLFIVGTESTNR